MSVRSAPGAFPLAVLPNALTSAQTKQPVMRRLARCWLALELLAVLTRPAESQLSGGGRGPWPAVGRPSAAALAAARSKENAMREPQGPETVTLSADETASLIEAGLDAGARRALDSIEVRLDDGRITLNAYVLTAAWDGGVLGPIATMLGPRERVSVTGPVRAVRAGLAAWGPDTFIIRSFSLPPAAIPHVVNQLTGGSDGTVSIAVPSTVRRIRILPTGVTFSRRAI